MSKELKTKIWLADFTHTGLGLASDAVPAAIGMIAEFVEYNCANIAPIEIFKYPDDLSHKIKTSQPDVIGFSNYVWNSNLSYTFIEAIKEKYPDIVVVWGGPNAPSEEEELIGFLENHSAVDFYIVKEAEIAFAKLITELQACQYKVSDVDGTKLPNAVFRKNGLVKVSNFLERVMDLESVPSPYLSGRLDSFLDGRLMPIIQTNRGCPFSCSFCTEGQTYWNKVRKKSSSIISKELQYISNFLSRLGPKTRSDLLIADSNFGMFPEDLETCKVIANSQKQNGYPTYINVATGKNKKERVLEAARLVNGAMKLAGSVQSLDKDVQANMKRSNISSDQIIDMALEAKEIGTNTYSEVILCLPGDTKHAHFETLRTLVNADFSTISMYQLMILPGTEFGLETSIEKYQMQLKYRAIPRAFGKYNVLGITKNIVEVEAVCVSNNTMSYEDYLECRRLNLFINIFFNDRIFEQTLIILRFLKVDIFNFLITLMNDRSNTSVNHLVDNFIEETKVELYDNPEMVLKLFESEGSFQRYLNGDLGSNLIFKFKSLSMTEYFPEICNLMSKNLTELSARSGFRKKQLDLLKESVEFRKLQIENIFSGDFKAKKKKFNFSFNKISEQYVHCLDEVQHKPYTVTFTFTKEQKKEILNYLSLFGGDITGISRILSRARLTSFFRSVSC